MEKDSGCFQVLSYSSGAFEEAELSGTLTHSLCGLFMQLLPPWPVPVQDAWLGGLAGKPSFISNSPGGTGVITDFKWELNFLKHLGKAMPKSGPETLLAKARTCSSSFQFGASNFIISLTSLTSRL